MPRDKHCSTTTIPCLLSVVWTIHKTLCGKKGDFRVGDVTSSIDPFGFQGTGRLVRIKAPSPDDPDPQKPSHWEVESLEEDEASTKITKSSFS
jgi:hypothetical protein